MKNLVTIVLLAFCWPLMAQMPAQQAGLSPAQIRAKLDSLKKAKRAFHARPKAEEPSGVLRNDSAKRPKNIIFMIGDGMGVSQITAGMYTNGNYLNLERAVHVGLIKTHSSDDLVTDSAAGATSFASGIKTYNGAIGVNTDTVSVPTIVEMAEAQGMKTGLVATSTIVHATPACYFSHRKSRALYEEIALDLPTSGIDIFIGGGRQYFDMRVTDTLDVIRTLQEEGYDIRNNIFRTGQEPISEKIGIFTHWDQPKPYLTGRDYLVPASKFALEHLKDAENGFFIMIEGSQIDWGGHANNSDYIVTEMIEFDKAIGEIMDFVEADGETLLVITADHETGGYAINPGSSLTPGATANDTIAAGFTTGHHTAVMVPVFAMGPGAAEFSGIYENTEIFFKMQALLGLKE